MLRSPPRFGLSWAIPTLALLAVVVVVVSTLLTETWGWATYEIADTDAPTLLRHLRRPARPSPRRRLAPHRG
jgi:hypothetical protein